jgi:hypothetical protein
MRLMYVNHPCRFRMDAIVRRPVMSGNVNNLLHPGKEEIHTPS